MLMLLFMRLVIVLMLLMKLVRVLLLLLFMRLVRVLLFLLMRLVRLLLFLFMRLVSVDVVYEACQSVRIVYEACQSVDVVYEACQSVDVVCVVVCVNVLILHRCTENTTDMWNPSQLGAEAVEVERAGFGTVMVESQLLIGQTDQRSTFECVAVNHVGQSSAVFAMEVSGQHVNPVCVCV